MFALISDFVKMHRELENVCKKVKSKSSLTVSKTSEFEVVLKSYSFVDKSLFIEALLKDINHPFVMITVPHQFGKSVNMAMLKCFMELEIDENGKEETNIVKDKYNYKLFNSVKLKIMKNKKIVETHFGKYPIIKVNFLCGHGISTYADAVMFCQGVVHEVFKKHRYLYKSKESNLEDDEKVECQKWCHQLCYKQFPSDDIIESLKLLSEYLRKFHGKKIFLLVDEFDSVISKAMFEIKDEQVLKKIINLSIGIIGVVVKDNSENVMGGFITGTLNLAGMGISNLMGNIVRYQFGSKHLLMNFYGFDVDEIKDLFVKRSIDDIVVKKVLRQYTGYYNEQGRVIYNPYLIVRFLEELNLKLEYEHIECLESLFKVQKFREMFKELLKGKPQEFNVLSALNQDDIMKLSQLTCEWKMQPNLEIICKYLFCHGYLTYFYEKKIYTNKLVISTNEISYMLKNKLSDFLMNEYQLDEIKFKNCQIRLQHLLFHTFKDGAEYIKAFENLEMQFRSLIESASATSSKTVTLETILSVFLKTECYCYNTFNMHCGIDGVSF